MAYILSFAMLPFVACKKQPLPEEFSETEPYDKTIVCNWDSCRVLIHWDLVNYYLLDDACMSLHLVPDSTDRFSVFASTTEIPELWERVADTIEAIKQRSQGKVTFDDAVINVRQIVSTNAPVGTLGIWESTAERFKRQGFKIKPMQGHNAKSTNTPDPTSWKKLSPKALGDKGIKANNHYTKCVEWGWNDCPFGPTEAHFKVYISDPKCDSVTFVPDSSIYSIIASVGRLRCNDWANIANAFYRYSQLVPGKIRFAGKIWYYAGEMDPETRRIFEKLNFTVIELFNMPFLKEPANTISFVYAQQKMILQDKSM